MSEERERAALEGQQKFEGTPCKSCGGVLRYTSNGNCTECSAKHASAYNKRMRELIRKLKASKGTA